jgi:histidine triad (HIT) family protein
MEKECLFCQIIAGNRHADIVYRDDLMVVFKDISPHAPVHLLLVPRKHIRSVNDLSADDQSLVGALIMRARHVAKEAGVDKSGYKLVLNVERGAGQVIFHLHMHLTGGWQA